MTTERKLWLAVLSALLTAISYPPSPFAFLIFIAFIPLLRLLRYCNPAEGFLFAWISGLLVNLVQLHWIFPYRQEGYWIISLLNPLQFAFFGLLFACLLRRFNSKSLWFFPFIWTALAFIRQYSDIAFTWLSISHTMSGYPLLVQFADITGAYGIVFWICVVNLLLYRMGDTFSAEQRKWLSISLAVIFFLPLFYGWFSVSRTEKGREISVAVVQPNIDSRRKWQPDFLPRNIVLLDSLTRAGIYRPVDLIVWPETAIPYSIPQDSAAMRILRNLAAEFDCALMTGFLEESEGGRFNSVLILPGDTASVQVYRKRQLVPFEEGIPFSDFFGINAENFLTGGQDAVPLVFRVGRNSVKTAAAICYESIFPNLVRDSFGQGAQLLCVLTNDGWFAPTVQSFQHMLISRLRAIEHRAPVIHCGNDGVSALIDEKGRVLQKLARGGRGVIIGVINLRRQPSVYSRVGDWPGIFSVFVTLAALTVAILKKNR